MYYFIFLFYEDYIPSGQNRQKNRLKECVYAISHSKYRLLQSTDCFFGDFTHWVEVMLAIPRLNSVVHVLIFCLVF